MDTNQLAEALARAVELAKPAQEYCLLWFWTDWWPLCMTKAEWSGWTQAIFSVLAIYFSVYLYRKQSEAGLANERRMKLDAAKEVHLLIGELTTTLGEEAKTVETWPQSLPFNRQPERLRAALPLIESMAGKPLPPECIWSLMQIRTAFTDLVELMDRNQGNIVAGHSRIQMALDGMRLRATTASTHVSEFAKQLG
ncbi:hypothetical protein [Acidovorax sp. A1169]|uniref:hypothetical protein n=1 Tax=Acidovorax sp. A1169 TaxID=3059524 RepID=UPI00273782A1|nr:hypothetical protein [Acidovorax sp. A1169]MDP4076202.1 hypothetical protein [Acidovorax sp. A1169]